MRAGARPLWLAAIRRLAIASAIGHLAWETLQLPLYTIWFQGTAGQIVFALSHCTGGDLVITATSLVLSLMVWGGGWPTKSSAYNRVMWGVIAIGIAYTVYSEWANVSIRSAWAYTSWMPRLPPLGTGLAPLLQWVVVPLVTFVAVRRSMFAAIVRNETSAASAHGVRKHTK